MVVIYREGQAPDTTNAAPAPQPNNVDNPYFGKAPRPVDAFWGLVSFKLSPKRIARMFGDPAFLAIKELISQNDTLDPDDKDGDFLYILVYLTDGAIAALAGPASAWVAPLARLAAYKAQSIEHTPLHTDLLPLMTAAEVASIMDDF